ncbi:MAG: 4Fe-4S binding protein [Desulfobacula sp.]|uniref:ATP-binding protein n=1 Tax=Desulfobacula sp. TaxID=2593537 RepID=UPI001DE85829|nr:4Fe-4S binding protein [Desulfobacula sp.]MBT3806232.1 4Fe-4S binding protein [Desulfobacula sp.]MBT4025329.1 4Fe-4S binding protein [Desulfobacula sp.]MBT4507139.1 4Fe-4S binding protein [Desulfobacula sp.]MBT6751422.1 4Fe-4S binding protein [Desulfobacula sp.]
MLNIKKMNLPDFIDPWLDRFYEPLEIDLLLILADKPIEKKQIVTLLKKNRTLKDYNNFDLFLERAFQRGVIKRLDDQCIEPEDFHTRYDFWALFEGWKDLPLEIKDRLNHWELSHYIESHTQSAEDLKKGEKRDPDKIYPEYILLDEVKALFKKIPRFYLWPCNCRAMIGKCGKSRFTCIRFSNNRGIGWEISREKALDIVKDANKKGLMQSAELGLDIHGNITGALCNCCSDCCFPHQLSEKLNVQKYWPLSRYLAQGPNQDCIKCGKCVKRCPFRIISQTKDIKGKKLLVPVIDDDQCRGCGVCATGCPEGAIKMKQIKKSVFETAYHHTGKDN